MSYQKHDLIQDLIKMEVKPDDVLVVHSSMKAIGAVEGGADTVLDAMMEYLEDGLLILPTHTWKQMGAEHRVFDPKTEPSCVGILTELFRSRPGVVRSLHPTHSVAVYGKRSREYVEGEELCHTPCPPEGCWGRMEKEKAKILLIGVGHERNTFIHAVEEGLNVPERLTAQPEEFFIRMEDGTLRPTPMHRHYNPKNPHISMDFPKLEKGFYENGAAKQVTFGDASCVLCEAEGLARVVKKVLAHEINAFIDREEIPEEWWKQDEKLL